jgi:uncharacterized protein with GYD domain
MSQFAYTPEAWGALAKSPEDRTEVVSKLLQQVGGKLMSYYYCFGEYDGVLIFEAPDTTAAVASLIGAVGAGHLKSLKTTVLITTAEATEAMRKAGSLSLPTPGSR